MVASQAEAQRFAELRSLDLDALRPVIDRVTRLARAAADVPHAYVTLVDEDRVWMSGFSGMPERFGPLSDSTTALRLAEAPIWQDDLRQSWPDHPWVTNAPYARFYANAPIDLAGGVRLGALCVGGTEPRARDEATIALLQDLAALVADAIERLRAQRNAEDAARESRAAIAIKQAIMGAAPVALAMMDHDLRYIYVNEQWTQDKGLTVDESLGRTLPELFPDSYPVMKNGCERALAGEAQLTDRISAPIPGRPERWLRAAAVPWRDGDGEVGGIISMTHEISDVVASLDRAERSEQRLHMALEIADIMVYEVNFRTRLLKIDGAANAFFDAPPTFESIGLDIWDTVHPEDRAGARAAWDKHLEDDVPYRAEYRMNLADGREVWASVAAEPVYGEDGRVEGVLGIYKDITARRQSEAAMARALDAAQAANRAKSEFLANMSHEIRTPLNGVMGVASALARTDLTRGQSEMVALIESSSQTLEAILADVLDLARVESGRLELKAEAFDLESCLRQAAALFRPAAQAKGLGFELEIAPIAAGTFVGDVVRLRQILCNLLSNAVKFTADGAIGLRAWAEEVDGRTLLKLTVTDTGIGFSPEVKARLFERFEQADGSITRRYGGTGLGLAISRALAEAMQGTLEADSRPRQGASFVLTLALDRAAPVIAAEPVASLPTPGNEGAPRVLLAEDHAINRKVVELLLGHVGVDLTCVENGAEAVEAAIRESFDLVLMDMQMPVMDGLSAIRLIRAAEKAGATPGVAIWALSANALPEHVEASMAAGANGHLSKPISAEALYAVLAQACAADANIPAALSA